jgi:hypothetical protein
VAAPAARRRPRPGRGGRVRRLALRRARSRLDGYFILTDLTGVPDFFGRIRPTLTSLLPVNRGAARVSDLRRGARIVVGAWIGLMVPMLAGDLG